MRQLVLYSLISLDGVAEEPGNWLFDAGDELFSNLGRIIEAQDDIILGAAPTTTGWTTGRHPMSNRSPRSSTAPPNTW